MTVGKSTAISSLFSKPETAAYLFVPVIILLGLVICGSLEAWLTLTIAGITMGLIVFIMASGLTMVFGLMDVMHFGHGGFVSVGAFLGASLSVLGMAYFDQAMFFGSLAILMGAMIGATAIAAILGLIFERIIIKPASGSHLKQMLSTAGTLIVFTEIIIIIWGPNEIPMRRPSWLSGGIQIGSLVVEQYRIFALVVGLIVFFAQFFALRWTKLGLLIRAGVENREMVQSLGYDIGKIFLLVFVVGSALAGLGGVIWGYYAQILTSHIGLSVTILLFVAIIIGGAGSIEGCLIAALAIGLISNYIGYRFPGLDVISNILLLVGVLMWRSSGLLPQRAS